MFWSMVHFLYYFIIASCTNPAVCCMLSVDICVNQRDRQDDHLCFGLLCIFPSTLLASVCRNHVVNENFRAADG